jgi:hypothetical protein
LRWIEQAEAREALAAARFERALTAPRGKSRRAASRLLPYLRSWFTPRRSATAESRLTAPVDDPAIDRGTRGRDQGPRSNDPANYQGANDKAATLTAKGTRGSMASDVVEKH